MAELETEVRLLKRELEGQTKIHDRLDVAIDKLTDVSNSIHRMLAVHEEKIARQEEAIIEAEQQIEISYIMKLILESAFLKNGDMSSLAGLLLSDFFYINLSISLDNSLETC